ncbi:MAG: PIN domain-containing protein [Bacteroidota bacterium]|nr:PIN domain-containing protein [Bacteroidota bacterium]
MNSNICLDTNILIYLFDSNNIKKREIAENLIIENALISFQSVSEFINVSSRLLKYSKREILKDCNKIILNLEVIPFTNQILSKAELLIFKYDFQIFDSIIIASALSSECEILYSEDFQNEMLIEGKLKIINPFL